MGNVGVGGLGVWVVKDLDGWRLAAFFMTGGVYSVLFDLDEHRHQWESGINSIPYSSHHVRVRHSSGMKLRCERTNIDFIHQI
jgi:hypothetical protein